MRPHAWQAAALQAYERVWLFHGMPADVASKVVQQGLNRSFSGRNATVFGKGCYLARDAVYSTSPVYAARDRQGVQRMLLCRAAVGEYCKGTPRQAGSNRCGRTRCASRCA